MLGRVIWFDDLSGEGIIGLEDGSSVFIHWSSIKGIKGKPKNGKKNWLTLEAGWIGRVKLIESGFWRQVSEFTVTKKAKPLKTESSFLDRDLMKAKLAAVYAEFDELFPKFPEALYDELHMLRNKADPSEKQLKRLEDLKALERDNDLKLKRWNSEKTAAVVFVYREHSRFHLNHLKASSRPIPTRLVSA